jgi:hypothetical protein
VQRSENEPVLDRKLDRVVLLTLPIQEPGPFSNVESVLVSRLRFLVSDDPARVVTTTSTVPDPAGETAVIELSLVTVIDDASDDPNLTDVAVLKPPPVMVTVVPPPRLPRSGPMEAIPDCERWCVKRARPLMDASST